MCVRVCMRVLCVCVCVSVGLSCVFNVITVGPNLFMFFFISAQVVSLVVGLFHGKR